MQTDGLNRFCPLIILIIIAILLERLVTKIKYLLLPIVLLIVLVSMNVYTMQKAAALSIVAAIVVGIINKDSRLTPARFLEALEAGGKGTITVATACAMAGIIAGCITVTGLASRLITAIVALSGNTLIIS